MGCGLLLDVSDRPLVLTCAHVVVAALPAGQRPNGEERPVGAVQVRAWAAAQGQETSAHVRADGWIPVDAGDQAGDLALLELTDPLQGEVAIAKLASWKGRAGHKFQCFGFPRGYKQQGQHAYGRMIGPFGPVGRLGLGREWVQLDAEAQTGYRVTKGFSGAPVWDVADLGDQRVVGLAVGEDEAHPEARVGAMIPLEIAAAYLPALKDRIPTGPPPDSRNDQEQGRPSPITLRIFKDGRSGNEELLLETDAQYVRIGRGGHNTIVLDDPRISWEHGEIEFVGGQVEYNHLSKNPAIIERQNGDVMKLVRGQSPVQLRGNDRLLFGSVSLTIRFSIGDIYWNYSKTRTAGEGGG